MNPKIKFIVFGVGGLLLFLVVIFWVLVTRHEPEIEPTVESSSNIRVAPPVTPEKTKQDPIIFDEKEIKINYRLVDFQYSHGLSPEYKEGQTVEFITQYPARIPGASFGNESILETKISDDGVRINSFNLGTYDKFLDVPITEPIILVRGKVSPHPTEKDLARIDVVHWEKADSEITSQIESAKQNIREFLNLDGNAIAKSMTEKYNIPNNFSILKLLSNEIYLSALDTKNGKAVFYLVYSQPDGKYHDGGRDTQEATMGIVYTFPDEKIQQIYVDYRLGFFFIGE